MIDRGAALVARLVVGRGHRAGEHGGAAGGGPAMGLVRGGRLVTTGTIADIKKDATRRVTVLFTTPVPPPALALAGVTVRAAAPRLAVAPQLTAPKSIVPGWTPTTEPVPCPLI